MYPQGSGAIVNTSADAAFNPIYGFALQAAGKGGIVNMTKTLAREASPRGIRVNAVSPGICRTQKAGADRPFEPPFKHENATPSYDEERIAGKRTKERREGKAWIRTGRRRRTQK